MKIRRYQELQALTTFEDRLNYLMLHGSVGRETFGFDRHLNQFFYKSREWKDVRHEVIIRDNGCDLGIPGYDIHTGLHIHHMNPIAVADILERNREILNPEFLIATTQRTHNAIHYGDIRYHVNPLRQRTKNDTKLW